MGLAVILLAALALIGALYAGWWSAGRAGYEQVERAAMPAELRSAPLFASEAYYAAPRGLPLDARVDQVYRLPAGLCCTETKTRAYDRPGESDVIQLSVAAYVLRQCGHVTVPYGFVRIRTEATTAPRYHRVALLDDAALAELVDRYRGLHAGTRMPRPTPNPGRCRGCGQRFRCQESRSGGK